MAQFTYEYQGKRKENECHALQIYKVEDTPKESFKILEDGIDGNEKGSLISGPMEVKSTLQVENKEVSNGRSTLFMVPSQVTLFFISLNKKRIKGKLCIPS